MSVVLAVMLLLVAGSKAQTGSPPAGAGGFRAEIVGADVVVVGGGKLRVVELPEDGLLYGPGGDMNPPEPNPGAPSTPRAALLQGTVPGTGCQAVPQVKGVVGFSALCPLQPGGAVRVVLGAGDDRLAVNGGSHGRYYNDVYYFLGVPLEVQGGAGDDRIETQTVGPVQVDAGAGDDRLSLGLSGPRNSLHGGPGDDSFAYDVTVSDYAYDGNPSPRTRRVDLDCGPGADFVSPYPRFRHGRGCPARPPRLTARPLTLRGTCRERCTWRGSRRIVVMVRNPTPRPVTLRSARLAIERWDSDVEDRRLLTLAHRKRLNVRARGFARIAMPARRRRALNRQLAEYILSFGVVPYLDLTGTVVERDGDRTSARVGVPIREKPITGIPSLD